MAVCRVGWNRVGCRGELWLCVEWAGIGLVVGWLCVEWAGIGLVVGWLCVEWAGIGLVVGLSLIHI